ncbi:MAG: beta-galactosidase, partial [Planctomycetota bacterium]
MPAITSDAHSFSIDTKRIWVVSGTVHMHRVPSESWRARLLDAKRAGLNTIETPVLWSACEPRPGGFDFKGQNDVSRFLEICSELGLRAILRIGPCVGDAYDMGGMPPWLIDICEGRLRTNDTEFLARCSTWYSKLASEIKKHQITAPASSAHRPVIAVQIEHEWCCDDPELATSYLGQLNRLAREAGIVVPAINRNNAYAKAEGEIDGWAGDEHLFAITRQLRTVSPSDPRMVIGLLTSRHDAWGEAARSEKTAGEATRNACEVLAAGGQFNLDPFVSGVNSAFMGGRLGAGAHRFSPAEVDAAAPVGVSGEKRASYHALRRICMFASSFERVFAGLDPTDHAAVVSPEALL